MLHLCHGIDVIRWKNSGVMIRAYVYMVVKGINDCVGIRSVQSMLKNDDCIELLSKVMDIHLLRDILYLKISLECCYLLEVLHLA